MVRLAGALAVILLFAAEAPAAQPPATKPPTAEIGNGQIDAKIHLPDPTRGFYRWTRFDRSGVIRSLTWRGHELYGSWFDRIDPAVYDPGYDEKGVVSAPYTAVVGPAEEFGMDGAALGFAAAGPGGTFIRIGVGILRKPQAGEAPVSAPPQGRGASDRYDRSGSCELVDPGKWTVARTRDSVEFTQALNDAADGYAYIYRKVIRLVPGKPQMIIAHSLKNTGKNRIDSTVYDHNFFVPDPEGPSQDLTITVPFPIEATRPPTAGLLEVRGNQLVFLRTLTNEDRATATVRGFGDTTKDYDIRVGNKKPGIGYRVTGDPPLSNIAVWSIRTVNAVEPYFSMSVEPGKEFTWNLTYEYYILPNVH